MFRFVSFRATIIYQPLALLALSLPPLIPLIPVLTLKLKLKLKITLTLTLPAFWSSHLE